MKRNTKINSETVASDKNNNIAYLSTLHNVSTLDCIRSLHEIIKHKQCSAVVIQKALQCGYPKASCILKILEKSDYIKSSDGNKYSLLISWARFNWLKRKYKLFMNWDVLNPKKFDKKNILGINENQQEEYLGELIVEHGPKTSYSLYEYVDELAHEYGRINELGLLSNFFVAQSVATILKSIDSGPHFVGIGCCSTIAYVIGITDDIMGLPCENGLIFERGFPEGIKGDYLFSFYLKEEHLEGLMTQLKTIYEDCVLQKEENGEIKLSVGDVYIPLIINTGVLREYAMSTITTEKSPIAVYQEDYMNLLHFVAGYSYDEANEIRKLAGKMKYKELEKIQAEFVSRCENSDWKNVRAALFDRIVKNIKYAQCKAYILSANLILDEYGEDNKDDSIKID